MPYEAEIDEMLDEEDNKKIIDTPVKKKWLLKNFIKKFILFLK